jgi:hypothetical protein
MAEARIKDLSAPASYKQRCAIGLAMANEGEKMKKTLEDLRAMREKLCRSPWLAWQRW